MDTGGNIVTDTILMVESYFSHGQALLYDPKLKSLHKYWHKDRIVEMLTRDDLLPVLSVGYVERLFWQLLNRRLFPPLS